MNETDTETPRALPAAIVISPTFEETKLFEVVMAEGVYWLKDHLVNEEYPFGSLQEAAKALALLVPPSVRPTASRPILTKEASE